MEEWLPIEEFPDYEVSDEGRVRNRETKYVLGIYDNGHGVMQVVMRLDGRPRARAVHKLVATAFLYPGPDGTVPIHLDGDKTNNTPDNLDWKPRWFAVKRTKQLRRGYPLDERRVRHIRTGKIYESSLEAANELGLLEEQVLLSALSDGTSHTSKGLFELYRK